MNRDEAWKSETKAAIRRLGHRNWILVADAAYPAQTAAGVRVIVTDAPHVKVACYVERQLAKAPHVQPVLYRDTELDRVDETAAPGIDFLRHQLEELLSTAHAVPHEELIAKVDAAGREFEVLVLKTTCCLPYTTLFFELDCGYWDADRETALRTAMRPAAKASKAKVK